MTCAGYYLDFGYHFKKSVVFYIILLLLPPTGSPYVGFVRPKGMAGGHKDLR